MKVKQETIVDKFIDDAGEVDNPTKDNDKDGTEASIELNTYRSAGEREQGEDELLVTSLAEPELGFWVYCFALWNQVQPKWY